VEGKWQKYWEDNQTFKVSTLIILGHIHRPWFNTYYNTPKVTHGFTLPLLSLPTPGCAPPG
jgi:hypothetical protein